jgi:hypothetical protein
MHTHECVTINPEVTTGCREGVSHAINNGMNVSNVSPYNPNICLTPSELSLPYFQDSTKINAVFHLKQLDEYFTLRGVGKQMQLAVALRSITDASAKSWVSAIAHTLQTYDQFKVAFVRAFWSPVAQSNVRKSIYQDKYNKQDGLSLSAHFLQYAVVASYLQPKMMDSELINALMSHFSLNIQRSYATAQVNSIQDAIDFLQRLEVIEGNNESYRKSNPVPDSQQHSASKFRRRQM